MAWIGSSTATVSLIFSTAQYKPVYLRGLTFRNAGANTDHITFHGTANGAHLTAVDCYLWLGTSTTSSNINCGGATSSRQSYTELINCTFRFGNASQKIVVRNGATVVIRGGTISSAGATPTELFGFATNVWANVDVDGLNATVLGSSSTICGDVGSNNAPLIRIRRSVFGAGCTVLGSQTVSSIRGVEVQLLDCKIGTKTGIFGYYNAFGSLETNYSVYRTAGASGQSWKIDTTANCGPQRVSGAKSTLRVEARCFSAITRTSCNTKFV